MKKHLLPFTFLSAIWVYFSVIVHSQISPAIQWHKTWGGGGVDQAKAVQQCRDGGYVMFGHTTSANGDVTGNHGSYDYWVVKMDANGTLEWQKSLGGTGMDWGTSIQQTTDDGFIVAGFTTSNNGDVSGNHGDYDYWLVKLDDSGNIQWQKSYGGMGIEQAKSIRQCADGGYIVAGSSWSSDGDVTGPHGSDDYWVVKLDTIGNLQWQYTFGGTGNDLATCVRQTADHGYVVVGYTNSSDVNIAGIKGGFDYWIIKLDSIGTVEWSKRYGGEGDDEAFSVQQTRDDGYIIAGFTSSIGGDITANKGTFDYWIVKLDDAGALQWQKTIGGSGVENAYAINLTADGGYIVAGNSNSNNGDVTGLHGSSDSWLVKLNANGVIQWQKMMGGSAVDQGYDVEQTTDGGYIVAGFTVSSNGDLNDDNINGDYWIIKLENNAAGIEEQTSHSHVSVFPNPSNNWINVDSDAEIQSIDIYTVLGQRIRTEKKSPLSIADLPAGAYLLYVKTNNGVDRLRIIKQ